MCELFAISSKQPTTVSVSIDRFARRGSKDSVNKDGWGIVYYADGDIRRFRDIGPAADSEWVRFVEKQTLCSTQVIAHIRAANVGDVCLPNTHPFSRELGGNVHTFEHNGFLKDVTRNPLFALKRFQPIGTTDSEWVFCALLDRLSAIWMADSSVPDIAERFEIITRFASEIRNVGLSNFIYCDGDAIFVHGDRRLHDDGEYRAPGLWLLEQTCPSGEHQLSGGVTIDSPRQKIAMAASVPLTDDGWEPMEAGLVVALKNGEIVHC